MAVWQYTVYLVPVGVDNSHGWHHLKYEQLTHRLTSVFGTENALHGLRSFGPSDESCADLFYNPVSGLVEEISFRFDLRSSIKAKVEAVLDLAVSLNAVIVTEDSKTISPERRDHLRMAILESNAAKFVRSPLDFITSLERP